MARTLDLGLVIFADDKASRTLVRVRVNTDQLDQSVARTSRRLQDSATVTNQNFVPALRGLTFAAAGAAAAIAVMSRSAGVYQRQIRLAGFLTGETGAKLASFDQDVRGVARDLALMPVEAAKAAQAVGRLGFRGSAALDVLRASSVVTAASLGDLSSPQAVAAVGTALRAFGQNSSQATVASDSLTNAVNRTSLNFKKLPLALGTASGFAAGFGANLNELLALLGATNDVIPRTERAATGVRNIFRDLSQQTTQAKLAQAGLNIELKNGQGEFRPILSILKELFTQLSSVTSAQRLQTLQQVFSIEAATTLAALNERIRVGFQGTNGEVVKGVEGLALLAEQMGTSGAAIGLAREGLKGMAGASQRARAAIAELSIQAGTAFNIILEPAVRFVTGALQVMSKVFVAIPTPVKILISVLAGLVVVAGSLSTVIIGSALALGTWSIAANAAGARGIALIGTLKAIAFRFTIVGVAIAGVIGLLAFVKSQFDDLDGQDIETNVNTTSKRRAVTVTEGTPAGVAGIQVAAPPTSPAAIRALAAQQLEAVNAATQAAAGVGATPAADAAPAAPGMVTAPAPVVVVLQMDGREVGRGIAEADQRDLRRTHQVRPMVT